MSSRIVPCDSCGSPIRDSDLETGRAVLILGKRYCAGCKSEAMKGVSLDELSGPVPPPAPAAAKKAPPPAPKPAAARPPAAKAPPAPPSAPPPAPARVERKALARRPSAPAAPRPRGPLIAAVAGGVLLLVAGGATLALREPSRPSPSASPRSPASIAPAVPAATPEARAREAFLRVQELAAGPGASAQLILAAVEKARPACKGTAFEKQLETLATKAQRDKESEDSARELAPLIDELKGAVATDSEFKRYSELQPKFLLAVETAAKAGSSRVGEIRTLQNDYNSRYEKLAEPYAAEIREAAVALADERRYDDAIRKIDTFPPQFRNSGTWATLQKLRQDIERKKKK